MYVSFTIPSLWVWAGLMNVMVIPVIRLCNKAQVMGSLTPWLGHVRIHFSGQGGRFCCWPWRSKLSCCENGGGHMARSWGCFLEPRAVLPNSQQKSGDLNHIAAKSRILPTPAWAWKLTLPWASRWEGRLIDTLILILWILRQKPLPGLWPTETER